MFWLLERPAATNEKPLEGDHVDHFFEISENYICIIHEESFLQRSDIVLENSKKDLDKDYEDDCADLIYASHVIEYFDYH